MSWLLSMALAITAGSACSFEDAVPEAQCPQTFDIGGRYAWSVASGTMSSWNEARVSCQAMTANSPRASSDLLVLNSDNERVSLLNLLRARPDVAKVDVDDGVSNLWIGAFYDKTSSGGSTQKFRWIDVPGPAGLALPDDGRPWHKGEPNSDRSPNCVDMSVGKDHYWSPDEVAGFLDDDRCERKLYFICECN